MNNFFAELKRRNVIRAAGLYLVGAWLITQVASTVLPTFDVPSWALRGLIVILAIGFRPSPDLQLGLRTDTARLEARRRCPA